MREAVVLIHGIWMRGLEMSLLRWRLRRAGFHCYRFNYRSVSRSPAVNAEGLNEFLETVDADVVHLLAHSLGGLIVMHLFDQFPAQKPGRVLMLGTPIKGSAVAHHLMDKPLLGRLLGKATERALLGDVPRWKPARELGMIAGSRGAGLGHMLMRGLPKPNDGVVGLEETRSPDINVHLTVPYSHTGLLFSTRVATVVVNFLRSGEFDR